MTLVQLVLAPIFRVLDTIPDDDHYLLTLFGSTLAYTLEHCSYDPIPVEHGKLRT